MSLHLSCEHITETTDAFMGAFIHQDSYIDLLKLVELHYGLQMISTNPTIPHVEQSYMLMTQDPRKVWSDKLGHNIVFNVNALMHNESLKFVVALVQLNNNYTPNKIPHVVIARNYDINNAAINLIIEGAIAGPSTSIKTFAPMKIRGKLGTMTDSGFENKPSSRIQKDGVIAEIRTEPVLRPEVSHSVAWKIPNSEPSMDQFKNHIAEMESLRARRASLAEYEKTIADRERALQKNNNEKDENIINLQEELRELRRQLKTRDLLLREYEIDRKVGAKIPINDISEDKTENTEEAKEEAGKEAKEAAKAKEGKEEVKEEAKAKEEAKEERTDKDKRRVPKKYTKKQKEVELNISHNGFPMYQGPGGGKYYYRDGKKVYVYSLTDTNPNVVYSVHPVRSS